MALEPLYLPDTSALARMRDPVVRSVLTPVIELGLAVTTPAIDAEMLVGARDAAEHARVRERRRTAYLRLEILDHHWEGAFDVQAALARSGRHHRAVGIADLLNSVVAVERGLTILHYDHDFEVVADVIDLRHRWVAPRGTLR